MKRVMKKSLSLLLALMMLLSMTQLLSFAWNQTPHVKDEELEMNVSFAHMPDGDKNSDGKINRGDYIYVVITAKGISTLGSNAFYYSYNPNVLRPVVSTSTDEEATVNDWIKATTGKLTSLTIHDYPGDETYAEELNGIKPFFEEPRSIMLKEAREKPGYSFFGTTYLHNGVLPVDENGETLAHADINKSGQVLLKLKCLVLSNEDPEIKPYKEDGFYHVINRDDLRIPAYKDNAIDEGKFPINHTVDLYPLDQEPDPAKLDELNKAITAAEALVADKDLYVDFTAVESALTTAKAINQETATADDQKEIDAATEALNTAVAALRFKSADYSAVETAIAAANSKVKDNYVDFTAVEKAINDVKYGLDIRSQEKVTAMADAINKAVSELVLKGADYTAVDKAEAVVKGLDRTEYVDFTAVDTAMGKVVRGYDITRQDEVTAMADAINKAVSELVLKGADYTAVEEAIAKADKLDPADYSNWDIVKNAIDSVEYDLNIRSQEKVTAMADDITDAISKLIAYTKYTLTVESVNGTVTANGTPITSAEYVENTDVTLVATANDGYQFAYWTNESGRVISRDAEYTTTMVFSKTLKAVYVKASSEETFTVTFFGKSGQVLDVQVVELGNNATAPEVPFYAGYTFADWNKDYKNVTSDMEVTALYTADVESHTITPADGVLVNGSDSAVELPHNSRVTVTAADTDNFGGWSLDGGKTIISYAPTYTFYAGTNVTVTLVTGAQDAKAVSAITNVETGKGYVAILTERTAPEGYTLVSTGIIISKDSSKTLDLATAEKEDGVILKTSASADANGQYRLTMKTTSGTTLYFNSFAVYKNAVGEIVTVYGSAQSAVAE